MVAQVQPAPRRTTAPAVPSVAGQSRAKAVKSTPQSTYDLNRTVGDFTTWRTTFLNYYNNTLIPIDNFYEMRQPTTPFFSITGQTLHQHVSPKIRDYLNGIIAYVRHNEIRVTCPEDENPDASPDDCQDAANALRSVLDWHLNNLVVDIFEQIKFYVGLKGACFVQCNWLTDATAESLNRGYPVRLDVYDPFECAWRLDPWNNLAQVIIVKRKFASQIPADWLAASGVTDLNAELDVYEYWDTTASGAVINGQIVKPLTPHGYTVNGVPACPVVYIGHNIRPQRLGGVAPLSSGVSQTSEPMGSPIVEDLLQSAQEDSIIGTRLFYRTDLDVRGLLKVKGVAMRDGKAVIDFDAGVLELEDTPTSSAEWLGPPSAPETLKMLMDMVSKDSATASASQAIQAGDTPQGITGPAANGMTSWVRARAESFSISLERGLTKVLYVVAGMIAQFGQDSAEDLHNRANPNSPLKLLTPPGAPPSKWQQGKTLPGFTGKNGAKAGPAMFENIVTIRVDIEPGTRIPQEVEVQQALALGEAKNPLMPMDWIREHKMHASDVQGVKYAIQREAMERDPSSIWGQIAQREAMVMSYLPELDDPAERQNMLDQFKQYKQQMILQSLQAPPQQPAQGGGGPPMPQSGPVPQPPAANTPQSPGPPSAPPAMPPPPPPTGGIANMPPGGGPGAPPFQPPQLMAAQNAMPTPAAPPMARPRPLLPQGGPLQGVA